MSRISSFEEGTLLINNSGNNGDIITTINFNRSITSSNILMYITTNKTIKPTIYINYYENGSLKHNSKPLDLISSGFHTVNIDLSEIERQKYVSYYIRFECLHDNTTIDIYDIGVSYEIDLFNDYKTIFKSSKKQDINENFLSRQELVKNKNFSIIVNRKHLEQILNILEKPFKLHIDNNCFDYDTKNLICNSINIGYVNNYEQFIKITLQNVEEI